MYNKQQRDNNKLILNIEVKPANNFQKKVILGLLKDIKVACLNLYYSNKNNEINIGDNFKK